MDGTLLNDNQEISERNLQAIWTAREKGIDFLVSTGRSYRNVRHVLDQADIDCPAICLNGAEIRDQSGNIEYSIGLDELASAQISAVFNDAGMYYELYTNNGTYTQKYDQGLQTIAELFHETRSAFEVRNLVEERFQLRNIQSIKDQNEIFQMEDGQIYTFLAFSKDASLLEQVRKQLKEIDGVSVTSFDRHNIEVTHSKAKKGIALKKYTEKKGILLANTMALGDYDNDLSMLKIVGYSVAMGNAKQRVKDVCRYETGLNSEDGFAQAVMKALQKST